LFGFLISFIGSPGTVTRLRAALYSAPGRLKTLAMTYDHLFLLTYTPRDGAEEAGYVRWLRQVDNPFFNRVPEVAHYSNWRLVDAPADARYRYFDLMGMVDAAAADRMFGRDDVKKFTAHWRELWGRDPGGSDLSRNAEVFRAERTARGNAMARWAAFVPGGSAAAMTDRGFSGWRIVQGLRSEPGFRNFAIKFLASDAKFGGLPAEVRAAARLAECIASPERF
jgi:hypothetical protein